MTCSFFSWLVYELSSGWSTSPSFPKSPHSCPKPQFSLPRFHIDLPYEFHLLYWSSICRDPKLEQTYAKKVECVCGSMRFLVSYIRANSSNFSVVFSFVLHGISERIICLRNDFYISAITTCLNVSDQLSFHFILCCAKRILAKAKKYFVEVRNTLGVNFFNDKTSQCVHPREVGQVLFRLVVHTYFLPTFVFSQNRVHPVSVRVYNAWKNNI